MGFIKIQQVRDNGAFVIVNAEKITTVKVALNGNYIDFICELGESPGTYGQLRAMADVAGSLDGATQDRYNDYVIQALNRDSVVCIPFAGQEIKSVILDPTP